MVSNKKISSIRPQLQISISFACTVIFHNLRKKVKAMPTRTVPAKHIRLIFVTLTSKETNNHLAYNQWLLTNVTE
jgi:hypothetical protein